MWSKAYNWTKSFWSLVSRLKELEQTVSELQTDVNQLQKSNIDDRKRQEREWERTRNQYTPQQVYPGTWLPVPKTGGDGRHFCMKCYEIFHTISTLQQTNSAYSKCHNCGTDYRVAELRLPRIALTEDGGY